MTRSLAWNRGSDMVPAKDMDEGVMVSKCYECGETMAGRLENYRYVECGLPSVVLKQVLVFRCKKCGAVKAQICAASVLHRIIAYAIMSKETRLSGLELRFLRKVAGYSATDFAVVAGTSKSVVSRWEHSAALGKQSDRLARLLCAQKLLSDSLSETNTPNSDGDSRLEEARDALAKMEDTLRRIHAKKKGKCQVQYEIDPVTLSRYGMTDEISVEAVLQ